MLANRVWVWVHRGTSSDRRTGFVEMSDADARGAIVGGRAQDPMVGLLALKHIDYTVPGPGRRAAPPDTTAPYRRRKEGDPPATAAPVTAPGDPPATAASEAPAGKTS